MRLLVVCLVAATLLWPALAQGPDADPRCIDPNERDPSFEPYPEDWHVLFDTHNYERLLSGGGRLQTLNNDGGNGWRGQASVCREQLYVCDYRQPTQPQNNWVFTQYISYSEAIEVFVNATYDYTSCATNFANGCRMLQTTMYHYERNQEDNNARRNPNNYLPNQLQVLSASRAGITTSSFTFLRSGNMNGFYLGVQDTGTCGIINRITMFYRVCPGRRDGLVTFPETPRPSDGAQPVTRNGACAGNASSSINPIQRAFADGRCETMASCACNPGFRVVANGERCQACPAGTYRSASDPAGSCLVCPEITDMTRVAAPICTCLVGHYRARAEGAGISCTSPPSACTNLAVQGIRSTSATITWNRPTTVGRPDYYYNVKVSDPDRVNTFIQDNDVNYIDRRSRASYQVSGLRPHQPYVIRVSVHNGVSDLDPAVQMRRCEASFVTDQAAPGPPSNPRGLCTVVVWQEPEQPNGVISGYDIRFFRGGTSGEVIPKGSNEFFHVVENGNIPSGGSGTVTFQVSARTSNGRLIGPSSAQTPLNCAGSTPRPPEPPVAKYLGSTFTCTITNTLGSTTSSITVTETPTTCPTCPTCPPTTCPTCPTCPPTTCPTTPPTTCPTCPTTPPTQPPGLTVSISVDYTPPADFTPGCNEYRAASGPVIVTCTATGPGTGTVSYQWSSTCRDCPFQSATSSSIRRAAVHSGDTGTHNCVATRDDGFTGRASIDFNVVDCGMHLFRGSPRGNLLNNSNVFSANVEFGFRLRLFCRSDSMSENVGQFIGPNGNAVTSNSFFAIANPQPGEVTLENRVEVHSPITASEQGVYTCRIPLESGEIRELKVGIFPSE